jgi:hypothetical protein
MKQGCLVVVMVVFSACASLPVKQQAVQGLQASEAALESAHDIERSMCFNTPATETGGHCTNPLAASIKLTDAQHQKLAQYFSDAFAVEIKAAIALKAWQAGQAAPTDIAGYQTDITAILALVQTLDPGAAPLVAQAQLAVNSAASTMALVGVK